MEKAASLLVLAGGEKAFEDEDGGNLIDEAAVFLPRFPHGVQMKMSLAGSEALIREMDRKAEGGAELLGKRLRLQGLWADFAGHVERIANDDLSDDMLAQDAADGFEVGMERSTIKSKERLHGDSQGICDGEADALAADIQAEDARRQAARCRFRLRGLMHRRSVSPDGWSRPRAGLFRMGER